MKNEIYPKNFSLPDSINQLGNLRWRLFKIKMQNNQWIDMVFNSKEKIEKFLIKNNPLAVYYSLSQYHQPLRRDNNPTYKFHKKIIDSEILLDIDEINPKLVRKIISLVKTNKLLRIIYSGNGFHLIYKPNSKSFIKERKELVKYLKGKNIDIDYRSSLDNERVARLWGTFNIKSQTYSQLLPVDMLQRFEANDNRQMARPTNTKAVRERQHNLSSSFQYKYISNKYKKGFVFFAKFKRKKGKVIQIIKENDKKYNLGDCYLIDYEDCIGVLAPKVFQKKRLIKILKEIKRSEFFQKYNNLFIRVSPYRTMIKDKPFYYSKPKKICVINGKKSIQSKQHLDFLKKLGFDIKGKTEMPVIYKGIWRKNGV